MYQSEWSPDPVAAPTLDAADFGDVSGVVLAHLLAPALRDLSAVPDQELLDSAVALARLESWSVAHRARVAAELLRRARADVAAEDRAGSEPARARASFSHEFEDERLARSMVEVELSLALGTSGWAADRDVWLGEGLAEQPELYRALASGRLDRRRAELVLREVNRLPALEDRRAVVRSLLGDGTHAADDPAQRDGLVRELRRPGTSLQQLGPGKLAQAVRRECHRRDPEAAAARAESARACRRVGYVTREDGQAELTLSGPAVEVGAAYASVDRAARAARAGGDDRNLDQLRHDITVGRLTEGAIGRRLARPEDTTTGTPANPAHLPGTQPVLAVIAMTDRTALGLDDEPATFFGPDGPVPLPAPLGRSIVHDPGLATWLGLYTDPDSGVAVDVSSRYRPPPRQRRFVTIRDGLRSRLPSSGATRIEIDHVTAYDHDDPRSGGRTTPANLASLGMREHHLKTDGALEVSGDANGALVYTTRLGREYVSWPEIWHEPRAG